MQAESPNSTLTFNPTLSKSIKNKPQTLSLNEVYQNNKPSSCGYCDKNQSYSSSSFSKNKMETYTYQMLMQRGWRRCGTYYYKPDLQKSCCKLFTHRLEAPSFKIKKDQRKALKKVMVLAYECIEKMQIEKKETKSKNKPKKVDTMQTKQEVPAKFKQIILKEVTNLSQHIQSKLTQIISPNTLGQQEIQKFSFTIEDKLKYFTSKNEDKSDYYCNYVMLLYGINKKLFTDKKYSLFEFVQDIKKAVKDTKREEYEIQIERGGYLIFYLCQKLKKEKTSQFQILGHASSVNLEEGLQIQKEKSKQEKEGGIITSMIKGIKQKITGHPKEESLGLKKPSTEFEVLKPEIEYKGEISITYNKITFGKLTIDIVKADETDESFRMYQRYCTDIHEKGQKSMSSYIGFLCLRALDEKNQECKRDDVRLYQPSWDISQQQQKPKKVEGKVTKMLGCHHMKYYLQGKLIGVGVVDILNNGLSSVYYFYEPEYKQARLGVFSSLIEIQYTRYLSLSFPQFKYYYMGFYIQDCEKMRYKADYSPCHLLCPKTYNYVQFTDELKHTINRIIAKEEKVVRLAQQNVPVEEDFDFPKDVGPYIDGHLNLVYKGQKLVLSQINPAFFVPILNILKQNLQSFGKKVFDMLTFTF